MEKKTIIFDFDGTIANTVEEGVRVYNQLAPKYGFKQITPENSALLRGKRTLEGLKALNVPLYKLAFVAGKIRNGLKASIHSSPMYPEMETVLPELKRRGYNIMMLSSNSEENIWKFLEHNNLAAYFDFIYTGSSILGKARHIAKVIKAHHLDKNDVYYIGDEVRDMEAAFDAGVHAIAVTWGLNDAEAMRAENPFASVDHPNQLLDVFK